MDGINRISDIGRIGKLHGFYQPFLHQEEYRDHTCLEDISHPG
jgi:hypothetical protein